MDWAFRAEALYLAEPQHTQPVAKVGCVEVALATRRYAPCVLASSGQSRSRRGNCHDNAHAQSFRSRFKAEPLDAGQFPNLEEGRLEISYRIAY